MVFFVIFYRKKEAAVYEKILLSPNQKGTHRAGSDYH
jgi:hypothetical protein